jgi:hypothetical protein
MMPNPYFSEKLAQAHNQELFHEAEQHRMLAQLPRRHTPLMQNVAGRFAAFFMSLPFSAKKVEHSGSMVTGQL